MEELVTLTLRKADAENLYWHDMEHPETGEIFGCDYRRPRDIDWVYQDTGKPGGAVVDFDDYPQPPRLGRGV